MIDYTRLQQPPFQPPSFSPYTPQAWNPYGGVVSDNLPYSNPGAPSPSLPPVGALPSGPPPVAPVPGPTSGINSSDNMIGGDGGLQGSAQGGPTPGASPSQGALSSFDTAPGPNSITGIDTPFGNVGYSDIFGNVAGAFAGPVAGGLAGIAGTAIDAYSVDRDLVANKAPGLSFGQIASAALHNAPFANIVNAVFGRDTIGTSLATAGANNYDQQNADILDAYAANPEAVDWDEPGPTYEDVNGVAPATGFGPETGVGPEVSGVADFDPDEPGPTSASPGAQDSKGATAAKGAATEDIDVDIDEWGNDYGTDYGDGADGGDGGGGGDEGSGSGGEDDDADGDDNDSEGDDGDEGYIDGGLLNGPNGKKLDINAHAGEYVLQASAVKALGPRFLDMLNKANAKSGPKFRRGILDMFNKKVV